MRARRIYVQYVALRMKAAFLYVWRVAGLCPSGAFSCRPRYREAAQSIFEEDFHARPFHACAAALG